LRLDLWSADLDRIFAAADKDTLSNVFGELIGQLGGSGFAVSILKPDGTFEAMITNGINGWLEFYATSNLTAIDPAKVVSEATEPWTWDAMKRAATTPGEHAVFQAASRFGLEHAITIPISTRAGRKGAVFVQLDREVLSEEDRTTLMVICANTLSRLEQLAAGPNDHSLSGREHEVLKWFAAGKSATDVGQILGIAMATVMFHYQQVAKRYGTLNRTHTVVVALQRGALKLDDAI
jgi:LuxR family transcriptional regulator, quorum-sensing system regulator BjaR1